MPRAIKHSTCSQTKAAKNHRRAPFPPIGQSRMHVITRSSLSLALPRSPPLNNTARAHAKAMLYHEEIALFHTGARIVARPLISIFIGRGKLRSREKLGEGFSDSFFPQRAAPDLSPFQRKNERQKRERERERNATSATLPQEKNHGLWPQAIAVS